MPVIVAAQFAGTSLWFAPNAVLPEIREALALGEVTAWATGAVQVGFILGTLAMSVSGLADRVAPRRLFLVSSVAGALANGLALAAGGLATLLVSRLAVGVALAGVYPIGMKVAAGWYRDGLGRALGWLVGALVVGTAFPHLLRATTDGLPWQSVILGTSALAVMGGVAMAAAVPEGPHTKPSSGPRLSALPALFRLPSYRAAAAGYVGHMWELYTFWALLPTWLVAHTGLPASSTSFAVIGIGAVGCLVGGWASHRWGSVGVARAMLVGSGLCCLVAPAVWGASDAWVLGFLLTWGFAVVGDSPQLSTLSARSAPPELVGTGLALATAVGFATTVVSLEVVRHVPVDWMAWALLPGPVLGLLGLRRAA